MPTDETNAQHIDVRYIAKLARLNLTDQEATTFQTQLESIIHHVESLSEIVLPADLLLPDPPQLALLRDDTPHPSLSQPQVLQNAPDQAQSQVRVPKVVADA